MMGGLPSQVGAWGWSRWWPGGCCRWRGRREKSWGYSFVCEYLIINLDDFWLICG